MENKIKYLPCTYDCWDEMRDKLLKRIDNKRNKAFTPKYKVSKAFKNYYSR